jgi:hypothetical protein
MIEARRRLLTLRHRTGVCPVNQECLTSTSFPDSFLNNSLIHFARKLLRGTDYETADLPFNRAAGEQEEPCGHEPSCANNPAPNAVDMWTTLKKRCPHAHSGNNNSKQTIRIG